MNKKLITYILCGILICTLLPYTTISKNISTNTNAGDLIIHAIYPIQVIDNANAMVVHKDTVFRIVVRSSFSEEIYTDIKITFDFGNQNYLEDGIYDDGIPIVLGTNVIYSPGGPALPGHDTTWDPEGYLHWTQIGYDSTVKAEIDPFNIIEETDETNNMKVLQSPIPVNDADQLKILAVPVAFPGEDDWSISDTKLETQIDFLQAVYPLAESDLYVNKINVWRIYSDPGPVIESFNWLFEEVAYPITLATRMMGYDRVIIVLQKPFGYNGVAIGMLRDPLFREPVIVKSSFPGTDLVAHEIGHTYYLWHPHDLGPPIFTATEYDLVNQQYNNPVNNFMSYRGIPSWIDKGRYDSDPKLWLPPGNYYFPGDPEIGKAPMNYNMEIGTWEWNLFDQLTSMSNLFQCILIHGFIEYNGPIIFPYSWFEIMGTPSTPQQINYLSKNQQIYEISLLNEENQTISRFPFRASFSYHVHNDKVGDFETIETTKVPFMFNIKKIEGAKKIQIKDEIGQVLVVREITPNAPEVTVNSPNGGERFKIGKTINIKWNAVDKDEDTLRHTIAYSTDNGNNWVPLAFDINESNFEWDTTGLERGDYIIKVISSDGINTGEDISDRPFALPKNKATYFNYPLLNWLINRFPNTFPILRYGLEL
jgi:hypothetical protein